MTTVAASSPAIPNTLAMFAKRFSKPNATPVLMFATDQKTKKNQDKLPTQDKANHALTFL